MKYYYGSRTGLSCSFRHSKIYTGSSIPFYITFTVFGVIFIKYIKLARRFCYCHAFIGFFLSSRNYDSNRLPVAPGYTPLGLSLRSFALLFSSFLNRLLVPGIIFPFYHCTSYYNHSISVQGPIQNSF